jgi:hypothetical protein
MKRRFYCQCSNLWVCINGILIHDSKCHAIHISLPHPLVQPCIPPSSSSLLLISAATSQSLHTLRFDSEVSRSCGLLVWISEPCSGQMTVSLWRLVVSLWSLVVSFSRRGGPDRFGGV